MGYIFNVPLNIVSFPPKCLKFALSLIAMLLAFDYRQWTSIKLLLFISNILSIDDLNVLNELKKVVNRLILRTLHVILLSNHCQPVHCFAYLD